MSSGGPAEADTPTGPATYETGWIITGQRSPGVIPWWMGTVRNPKPRNRNGRSEIPGPLPQADEVTRVSIRVGWGVHGSLSGPSNFQVRLLGEPTVEQAIAELLRVQPVLRGRIAKAVFVVQGETVSQNSTLRDGDEIAILAAIAGGA
jgi:molybdopterin converting factor small subunit